MNKNIKRITLIIFSCAFINSINASKIEVVNENKKPITIKIRGISKMMSSFIKDIPGDYTSIFYVNKEDIKGNKFFSIFGVTNALTPSGKCEFLNIEKNYQITFIDDVLGTTCIAEEIPQMQPL